MNCLSYTSKVNLHGSGQKWDLRLKGQFKNSRVEFKNEMSDLIGFESPKFDLTPGPGLTLRFKRFRQKCELFDGPLKARTNEHGLLWTGDYTLDLFNTWNLSCEEQKLDEYWKRYEEHVKPQSNHILYYFYLRNIKQNGRALNDFLTEAKLLI